MATRHTTQLWWIRLWVKRQFVKSFLMLPSFVPVLCGVMRIASWTELAVNSLDIIWLMVDIKIDLRFIEDAGWQYYVNEGNTKIRPVSVSSCNRQYPANILTFRNNRPSMLPMLLRLCWLPSPLWARPTNCMVTRSTLSRKSLILLVRLPWSLFLSVLLLMQFTSKFSTEPHDGSFCI